VLVKTAQPLDNLRPVLQACKMPPPTWRVCLVILVRRECTKYAHTVQDGLVLGLFDACGHIMGKVFLMAASPMASRFVQP
jgi:hypothetical protein